MKRSISPDRNKKLLAIRADAGPTVGIGHLMRCITLANQWVASGGEAAFILSHKGRFKNSFFCKTLKQRGFRTYFHAWVSGSKDDLNRTHALLSSLNPGWVVLDGYAFGTQFQKKLYSSFFTLVLDDFADLSRYYADVILNQNLFARPSFYAGKTTSQLLLGSSYLLLRDEFRKSRESRARRVPVHIRHLLLTMGGADPHNTTAWVIDSLSKARIKYVQCTVVVGPAFPHHASLRKKISQCGIDARVVAGNQAMSSLMKQADLAITAAGSTCWELAFMGVPSLCIVLAKNQEMLARALAKKGISENLGWHHRLRKDLLATKLRRLMNDSMRRSRMIKIGRELVDGQGVKRVRDFLLQESWNSD